MPVKKKKNYFAATSCFANRLTGYTKSKTREMSSTLIGQELNTVVYFLIHQKLDGKHSTKEPEITVFTDQAARLDLLVKVSENVITVVYSLEVSLRDHEEVTRQDDLIRL